MRLVAGAVQTILALAQLTAPLPYVEALAVLFLALRLLAIAVLSVGPIQRVKCELVLALGSIPGSLQNVTILIAVGTIVAAAMF